MNCPFKIMEEERKIKLKIGQDIYKIYSLENKITDAKYNSVLEQKLGW